MNVTTGLWPPRVFIFCGRWSFGINLRPPGWRYVRYAFQCRTTTSFNYRDDPDWDTELDGRYMTFWPFTLEKEAIKAPCPS